MSNIYTYIQYYIVRYYIFRSFYREERKKNLAIASSQQNFKLCSFSEAYFKVSLHCCYIVSGFCPRGQHIVHIVHIVHRTRVSSAIPSSFRNCTTLVARVKLATSRNETVESHASSQDDKITSLQQRSKRLS